MPTRTRTAGVADTQLIFRLVDEWFIAMDPLREPISESTRSARWLPEGIGLDGARARLAAEHGRLDDQQEALLRAGPADLGVRVACGGWEVIGSKDELRERSVAGWDEFDGHSPRTGPGSTRSRSPAHRAASTRAADHRRRQPLARCRDRGPVDAAMEHRPRLLGASGIPADWISESFPGQFRNWFYALLTESTVMTGTAPMRTLFAYALLFDENGEEMHKSKGNAIPFDEAAERIGADVMRWMYAATNPAANLRFGYGPGHEVVRRFFLPLWNTYGFLVSYARLDGWTPDRDDAEEGSRTLLDRWILSRLDALVGEVRDAFDGYDAMRATRVIEAFVDDLSNWYVRRNRRRFWKGELDADKRAAYATLHEVLTTLTRLLAPIVPHLADAIWENLVVSADPTAPESVHLVDFPERVGGRADRSVEAAVALARRTVALGRAARSASGVRTRQPLRAVRVKLPASAGGRFSPDADVAAELTEQVTDELNVRALELIGDEADMVERSLYPLLPIVGPRHGRAVGAIMAGARSGAWEIGADGTALVGGVVLQQDEFELTARARPGHEVAEDGDLLVALDTELDDELTAEGLAREVAHRLQAMRKAAGYEISDRVRVAVSGDGRAVERLAPYRDWLADELLATSLELAPEAALAEADAQETVELDGSRLALAVARA
jgi:isoleucyl-tRNA synthetase